MPFASQMGMMFTAKDLASAQITKVDRSLKGLAASSDAAAAVYERNMARIRRGALSLSVAIIGFLAMGKVTKTFGQFQHTMTSAGIIMGATASEMRSLERAAIDAGIATQFSPREAAEGLQSLGAAGMTATQALSALSPVLDLAAASMGQLGVAGAAEVTVGVLNAFSMSANRATDVADKLTRITQLTNFQFRDFAVAISQSASQAASADQSFESMLATLGMLRNMNVHASVAATSYREAVRRLSSDKRAQKALSKLSIEVLDKETGKIRDLGSIMAQIAPKLEKMNSKEKGLQLTRIFGVRGMKVYSAFIGQYNKLVKEGTVATGDFAGAHSRLVSELNNASGAAAKNRDALLKTAEGQRLLLKGSWETTQIMLGRLALPVVLPALKAFTNALNIVIKVIDAIPGPLREMIGTFAGVMLAFKGLRGAIMLAQGAFGLLQLGKVAAGMTAVGAATTATTAKVTLLGRARGVFSRMAGSISGLLGPIGLVTAGLFALFSYMRKKENEEMQRQKQILQQNEATKQSYIRAWEMAKALRKETAKALAEQLNTNARTLKGARRVLRTFLKQYTDLRAKTLEARKRAHDMETKFGPTSPQANKAREAWIRLTGKEESLRKAIVAARAAESKHAIKRTRDEQERQVYAGRVVADRLQREDKMRETLKSKRLVYNAAIMSATGKNRVALEKQYAREVQQGQAAIRRHQRGTAMYAVRHKLLDRSALKGKNLEERLKAVGRAYGVAPSPHLFRAEEWKSVWLPQIRRGALPAIKTSEQAQRFARWIRGRREAGLKTFGYSERALEAIQRRMAAGEPAFGAPEERIEAAVPRVELAGVTPMGEMAAPGERVAEQAATIQNAITAAMNVVDRAVGRRPVVVSISIDGEKIATAMAKYETRAERDQDGTQEPSGEQGVQGAG